ncbi:hypothetical protein LTR43_002825 [Exophiala xenobiotica]|nr:hypothetical protein LTR14_003904 [Exophiala xenobiotica]
MPSYTGKFTFINAGAENLSRRPEEDFQVFSHVSRTYRKWSKDQRNKRLKTPRLSSSLAAPLTHSGVVCQIRQTESALQSNSPTQPETQNLARDGELRPEDRSLVPSPCNLLGKGNSDPFNAATIRITPTAHELLFLASQFFVFWAWPASVSKVFLRMAKEDFLTDLQDSLSHDAHLHTILAAGAYVKESSCDLAKTSTPQRAIQHKIHAMTSLRKTLAKHSWPTANNTLITVLGLLSLEFWAGNYQAADLHHRAAREFVQKHKFPGWHDSATFFVSDVWIAGALLRKPLASSSDWDPGSWTGQSIALTIPAVQISSTSIHVSVPESIRGTFVDISEIVSIKQRIGQLSEADKFHVVSWIDTRSAAIKGKLLETLADFTAVRPGFLHSPADLVFATTALAAVLFLNMIFILSDTGATKSDLNSEHRLEQAMPSAVFGLALEKPRKYFFMLLQHIEMASSKVDGNLMVWLTFIGAMASEVRPVTSNPAELHQAFGRYASQYALGSTARARRALSGFLYDSKDMDGYLTTILGAG